MRLRVLGPLEITVDGAPVPLRSEKQRLLLALLIGNANAPTAGSRLIGALWEDPPASAHENLRLYVYHLRKALGDRDRVVRHPSGYALSVGAGELDAADFEALTAEGARAMNGGEPAAGRRLLAKALELWRGPAYGNLADHPAIWPAATRLEEARLRAAELRITADLTLGRHEDLIGELTGLVAEHPTRERLRAHLMLALHRAGRRAEALETFREGRRVLIGELGLEPGAELRALHEEILRGDSRVPAPRPAEPKTGPNLFPTPAQLPHDVADFVGRTGELTELDRLLDLRQRQGVPAFLGLTGMGGVGKTGLAVHWAHRVAGRFADGQLYVDLRGYAEDAEPLAPRQVVDRFLRALGVPGSRIPDDVDERAGLLRSVLSRRRVLLVLDNARDAGQVRPLLPGSPGCAVMVTSRDGLDGLVAQERADILRVDTLGDREGVAVLAGLAGGAVDPADPELARLSELCGGLPLALRIAGARLAGRSRLTAGTLAGHLTDERNRLSELSHGGVRVRANFGLSYRDLDPAAATLFRRLSLLGVPDFGEWAGGPLLGIGREPLGELFEQLVAAQLLEVVAQEHAGGVRYRFHDLVRLFARERALEEDDDTARAEAMTRSLGTWLTLAQEAHRREYGGDFAVLRGSTPRRIPDPALADALMGEPIEWLAAERAGLVSAVSQAAEMGHASLAWELAMTCVTLFEARSLFDDWRSTHEIALAAARAAGDRLGEAAMVYGLGSLALFRQEYASAAEQLEDASARFEAIESDHGVGLALRNLALLDRITGTPERAHHRYKEAADLLREAGDRAAQAHAGIGLAQIKLEEGAFAEAEALLRDALQTFRDIGNRRGQAQALFRLGDAHVRQEQPAPARDAFAAALPLVRALGDLVGEAYLLRGLGQAQLAAGERADAETSMKAAVAAGQRVGDQFAEASASLGLGRLYESGDDLGAAVSHLERAVTLFAEMDNTTWRARAMDALAVTLRRLGDDEAARALWERACSLLDGLDSPEATRQAAELRSRLE
ncbi:AfsR/SARP family transcriptional regulator [Herbidospora sp. RD11066]